MHKQYTFRRIWQLIYVLCSHYRAVGAEVNTFTLTVKAEMFWLITVSSRPLQQIKVLMWRLFSLKHYSEI